MLKLNEVKYSLIREADNGKGYWLAYKRWNDNGSYKAVLLGRFTRRSDARKAIENSKNIG